MYIFVNSFGVITALRVLFFEQMAFFESPINPINWI